MRILPLYYLENLTDEEIQEHECSDRIWLNQAEFEHWLTSTEPGNISLLQITNSLDQAAIGCPYAIHMNSDYPDTIYIPSWMYARLDMDDNVQIQRFQPSLCSGLTLQPHTSDHLTLPDPETALRDAFERYACLMPGMDIPLWIGHAFHVTIAELTPQSNTPLCIRNCELELDLLPPLDTPAQDVFNEQKEEKEEQNSIIEHIQPENVLVATDTKKSRREIMAEAALRRMNLTQKN